jgi:heme/copper-type cytochrome/quinol oxidase subunit 2
MRHLVTRSIMFCGVSFAFLGVVAFAMGVLAFLNERINENPPKQPGEFRLESWWLLPVAVAVLAISAGLRWWYRRRVAHEITDQRRDELSEPEVTMREDREL